MASPASERGRPRYQGMNIFRGRGGRFASPEAMENSYLIPYYRKKIGGTGYADDVNRAACTTNASTSSCCVSKLHTQRTSPVDASQS
jgi:hypothetical protein